MLSGNKSLVHLLSILVACMSLVACGVGKEQGFLEALEVNSKNITALTVSALNVRVKVGETEQFSAVGEVDGGASELDISSSVTWTSTNPAVVSIDSTGLATGLANGTVDIVASLSDLSGSKSLKSSDAAVSQIEIGNAPSSISVCQTSAQVPTALATYDDGDTALISDKVVWSSSDPALVYIGDEDLADQSREDKGVLSALAIGSGSANITASQGSVDSAAVTVAVISGLSEITIRSEADTLYAEESYQFTASGTYGSATVDITDNVNWAPAVDESTILVFSDDEQGLASTLIEGSVSVTANCDPDSENVTGTLAVDVEAPIVFQEIRINDGESVLSVDLDDASLQLEAYIVYSDGSLTDITESTDAFWYSSDAIEGSEAEVSNEEDSKGEVSFSAIGVTPINVRYSGDEGTDTATIEVEVE